MISGRDPLSPEEQIRTAIKEMVEGAEERRLEPFKKHLSEQLEDQNGLGKKDILQRLRVLFLRHPEIHLSILSLDMTGSGNQVRKVQMELLMSSTSIPQNRGIYDFTFRQEDGDWNLWYMDWGQGYGLE